MIEKMSERQRGLVAAGQAPRLGHDFYETPPVAVHALLHSEEFHKRVWEPAAGNGAITSELELRDYDVFESDAFQWAEREKPLDATKDFLSFTNDEVPCASMITNPPFSLLNEFMVHAARLYALQKWAFLLPITALPGIKRFNQIYHKHHTRPSRIWVLSRRLKFRRHGYTGRLAPMGSHIWAVWDRPEMDGRPTIINWIEAPEQPR